MISIDKWTTIRTLHKEGHSKRAIAKMMGVSRNTVKRALRAEEVPKYKRAPRENKLLSGYEDKVFEMMEQKLIGTRIFKELQKLGYEGSITTVYRFLQANKQKVESVKTTTRFETAPGEQAQFDWSPYTVMINNEETHVYCFLLILGYSRKKYITFSKTQRMEAVLEALEEGIRAFGGVPKQIVVDNAKQLVLSHPKDDLATYHPKFLELAGMYHFRPYACQTYWPRTKGKVERPFYYIEQHFIKGNQFTSLEDVIQRGQAFLEEWETEPNKTTLIPPCIRFEEEKIELMDLPSATYSIHLKETRKVSWDCLISYRGVKYSVPHVYAGQDVWVRSSHGNVLEIYDSNGTLIYKHTISYQRGQTIMDEKHYEGVKGSLPKSLPKVRERFIETFPSGKQYVELLNREVKANHIHRYQKILELLHHYELGEINEAIEQAIVFKRTENDFVGNVLKKATRKQIELPKIEKVPEIKAEIRSLSYYSYLLH